MRRYSYCNVQVNGQDGLARMNELGAVGWHVVCTWQDGGAVYVLMELAK